MSTNGHAISESRKLSGAVLTLVGLFACGSSTGSGPAGNAVVSTAGAATLGSAGDTASGGVGGGVALPSGSSGSGVSAGDAGASTNAGAGAGGAVGVSAGGDAGASTSAGAGDTAAGSAGASATGCAGLFCEDFEQGGLDPAVWNTQTSGGQTVVVQSSVVAHGKYAAQFHAKPNILSYDFIITKNAPAALRGHHFGRAYFNVTPKPPAEHTGFLFAGSAGFPKLKYLEVAGIGAAWQLTYVNLIAGGESYASGGSAPDARWVCLEWEFNDAPDQATVFVDGVQSYARDSIVFNGQSTGLVGGFTDFGFGYYAWHPAADAFDIYYDDIVLDTKRVGCLSGP
jgi:hypothetical protein